MSILPISVEQAIVGSFTTNFSNLHGTEQSNRYLVAKVINDSLYCPINIYNRLPLAISTGNCDIVSPIMKPFKEKMEAGTTSRIMHLLYYYYSYHTIQVVYKKDGTLYTQSGGTLFIDDYKPLMMFMYVCDGYRYFEHHAKPVIMVSPSVFSNTDIISKTIVKSIIPNAHGIKILLKGHLSVIISDDIDSFIYKVNEPREDVFNDDIYGILDARLNSIS